MSKEGEIIALVFSVLTLFAIASFSVSADNVIECWQINTQSPCESSGECFWNDGNSRCERLSCYSGDHTNSTFCETSLNSTFNLSCEWTESTSFCDPVGGTFFGDGCDDFSNDADACYSSGWCEWNETSNVCKQPDGGYGFGFGSGLGNPGCGVVGNNENTCTNISGCSYASNACGGQPSGLTCENLNKSICTTFTALNSCCNWNGTLCQATFDSQCYSNIPALPIGATFCEDYLSFVNQSLCESLAAPPYYMPCAWDNKSSKCHFNSESFGGGDGSFASFNEVGTSLGCEAMGGSWQSAQYVDASTGSVKTDNWCDFNFGTGGNCDSSCWACEDGATSLSNAESTCESSALGYCQFVEDTYAFNGYGWCNAKASFVNGGGKSCDDSCNSCDYLNSPELECSESGKGCIWVNDTSALNGIGNCYGTSEKRCANDCFSCYDTGECVSTGNGGNGACTWDGTNNFCKPTGFSGEICFDGKDNDNDAKIDCADAECATDKFCGGEKLQDSFGNCPGFSSNSTCTNSGCVWIVDSFGSEFGGGEAGFCDFPGAQCFENDESDALCNATAGCSYISTSEGVCSENQSLFSGCFSSANESVCESNFGCGWNAGGGFGGGFGGGGWCEPVIFSQCFGNSSRQSSQSSCEENYTLGGLSVQICSWQFNHCEARCYSETSSTCEEGTLGLCGSVPGYCEPDSFGGKCYEADGNNTLCTTVLNASCDYFPDPYANNSVGPINASAVPVIDEPAGWCNDVFGGEFISFMGEQPPTVLGTDENETALNDSWDIKDVMIRDDFDRFMFGLSTYDNFEFAGVCNSIPLQDGGLGTGDLNHTFFWYLDTDGNSTNNCETRDNNTKGFEFSFKYQSAFTGSLAETKVAYRCFNGSWGAAPIPLSSDKNKMCDLVKGGMAGIGKSELLKFSGLFNKSVNLRFYATVYQGLDNDSLFNDSAGPFYYSPGSFDFKFEDCSNSGGDADGDGIKASNDPDCTDFLKFGFVPQESGFQCGDSADNDGDGAIDCADDGCSYDPYFCGGVLAPDPNDNTAPKITWQSVQTFPDSAFVMYDTNEPSNGSLDFYLNDSTCAIINTTVLDYGVIDPNAQDFKLWHDAPLDSYSFNPQALSSSLENGTTYFYKTRVCDISGNCAVSACTNMTTKASSEGCKSCQTTFTFPFNAPSGSDATDPVGDIHFAFELPDGSKQSFGGGQSSGQQMNYSNMQQFNLEISNPNATTQWAIKLLNASVSGKVATKIQNFSGSDDLAFNTTSNGTFIGLSNNKCQQLINTFRPQKLEIGTPGNISELWQCSSGLLNCTDKTANATRDRYNSTVNITYWHVPAEWGC